MAELKCKECGKIIPPNSEDMVTKDNDHFCDVECAVDYGVEFCDECWSPFGRDDKIYYLMGEWYCQACFDDTDEETKQEIKEYMSGRNYDKPKM